MFLRKTFLLALKKQTAMLRMSYVEGHVASNYWCPLDHEENLQPTTSKKLRALLHTATRNEIW